MEEHKHFMAMCDYASHLRSQLTFFTYYRRDGETQEWRVGGRRQSFCESSINYFGPRKIQTMSYLRRNLLLSFLKIVTIFFQCYTACFLQTTMVVSIYRHASLIP